MELNTLNDSELIYMINQNNSEAVRLLTKKYYPIIKSWINDMIINPRQFNMEYDDFYQQGLSIFLESIGNFRTENGIFYSYLRLIITREIKNFIYKFYKKSEGFKLVHLDALVNEDKKNTYLDYLESDCFFSKPDRIFVFKDNLEKIKSEDSLSNQEKNILIKIIEGYSYKEIAKIFGISTKKVDNVYAKIKRNLKGIKKELWRYKILTWHIDYVKVIERGGIVNERKNYFGLYRMFIKKLHYHQAKIWSKGSLWSC